MRLKPAARGLCDQILVLSIGLGLACSAAEAALMIADPDAHANEANISTAFDGVTLSTSNSINWWSNGNIYSRTAANPAYPSTGTRVFGSNVSGASEGGTPRSQSWYLSPWSGGFYRLRADFDNPANQVSIDMIGCWGTDLGAMWVYDVGGSLLSTVNSPSLTAGGVYTATYSSGSFNIGHIIASGRDGNVVALDNLQWNTAATIPEPSTFAIWSLLAVTGIAVRQRRRRRDR